MTKWVVKITTNGKVWSSPHHKIFLRSSLFQTQTRGTKQMTNQIIKLVISSRLSQPGPCEPPPPPPPILVDAVNGPNLNPNLKPIITKLLGTLVRDNGATVVYIQRCKCFLVCVNYALSAENYVGIRVDSSGLLALPRVNSDFLDMCKGKA